MKRVPLRMGSGLRGVPLAGLLAIVLGTNALGCGDSPTAPTDVDVIEDCRPNCDLGALVSDVSVMNASDRPGLATNGFIVSGRLMLPDGTPVEGANVAVVRSDPHIVVDCERAEFGDPGGEVLASQRSGSQGDFKLTLPDQHGEPFSPQERYGHKPYLDVQPDNRNYRFNGMCRPLPELTEKYPEGGKFRKDVHVELPEIELEEFSFDYTFRGTVQYTSHPSRSLQDAASIEGTGRLEVWIVGGPAEGRNAAGFGNPPRDGRLRGKSDIVENGNWEIELEDMGSEAFEVHFEVRDSERVYFASSHYAVPGANDQHPQQPNPYFTRRYAPVGVRAGGRLVSARRDDSNLRMDTSRDAIRVDPLVLVRDIDIARSPAMGGTRGTISRSSCKQEEQFEERVRASVLDEYWDGVRFEWVTTDPKLVQDRGTDKDVVRFSANSLRDSRTTVYATDTRSGKRFEYLTFEVKSTCTEPPPPDPVVTLSVVPDTVHEPYITDDAVKVTDVTVTATLDRVVNEPTTVDLTLSGSATINMDYTVRGVLRIDIPAKARSGSTVLHVTTKYDANTEEDDYIEVIGQTTPRRWEVRHARVTVSDPQPK